MVQMPTSRRESVMALLMILGAVILLACGEQTATTVVPADHRLYGQMSPVRIYIIDEAQSIRVKAECRTDHHHTSLVVQYQYADGGPADTIEVPQQTQCVPGAVLYESSPDAALALTAGQALSLRITVQYRNGSTSTMTRTYRRDQRGHLTVDP